MCIRDRCCTVWVMRWHLIWNQMIEIKNQMGLHKYVYTLNDIFVYYYYVILRMWIICLWLNLSLCGVIVCGSLRWRLIWNQIIEIKNQMGLQKYVYTLNDLFAYYYYVILPMWTVYVCLHLWICLLIFGKDGNCLLYTSRCV